MIRAGVILNPKSRRNREGLARRGRLPMEVLQEAPETPQALEAALAAFAARGLELLVVDGGDGTVREVLSRAPEAFGARLPRLALVPNGKTNVLARDLGVPDGWTPEAALAAAADPERARKHRRCLEVVREGVVERRGFVFGTGVYVRATRLAGTAHRLRAFGSLSVGLTATAAVLRCLAGREDDPWRAGEEMRLSLDGGAMAAGRRLLVLASTLEDLPLGLKPFGAPGPGLKALAVEAPPRRLLTALPRLLAGGGEAWLEARGYVRRRGRPIRLASDNEYVLDGEVYPAGELTVREGPLVEFVV